MNAPLLPTYEIAQGAKLKDPLHHQLLYTVFLRACRSRQLSAEDLCWARQVLAAYTANWTQPDGALQQVAIGSGGVLYLVGQVIGSANDGFRSQLAEDLDLLMGQHNVTITDVPLVSAGKGVIGNIEW